MIKRNLRFGYELTCDICGKGEKFGYFDYALEYKKDLGWISEKYNGEWQDICDECQEGNLMKTWEMIKELTEKPEKEFISYEKKGDRDVLKTKSVMGAIRFSNEEDNWNEELIGVDLDREWEEIKKPVDFMTAIKSGKHVGVEYSGARYREMSLPNLFYELQQDYSDKIIRQMILHGKWYIECQEGQHGE